MKLKCIIRHSWVMSYLCDSKGRNLKAIRECRNCEKIQLLAPPEKYEPSEVVWRDAYWDRNDKNIKLAL